MGHGISLVKLIIRHKPPIKIAFPKPSSRDLRPNRVDYHSQTKKRLLPLSKLKIRYVPLKDPKLDIQTKN